VRRLLAIILPMFCVPALPAHGQTALRIASAPTGQAFWNFAPERAIRNGVAGRAKIECQVTPDGHLRDCKVGHEWPQAFGFGAAALAMSKAIRMNGGPGVVTIPIRFNISSGLRDAYAVGPNRWVTFLTRPTWPQIAAAYPGPGGTVQSVGLNCLVNDEGRFEQCQAASANTAPKLFVDAALTLTPFYSVAKLPKDTNSSKIEFWVQLVGPDPEP
jgi:TonB family protein